MPNASAKRSAESWLRDPTALTTPDSVKRRSLANVCAIPPVPRIPHRRGLRSMLVPFLDLAVEAYIVGDGCEGHATRDALDSRCVYWRRCSPCPRWPDRL